MNDELQHINLREFLLWLLRFRRRYRISGNSMLPLLKPGDEVLINPRAYRRAQPQPGDIVVTRHPHRPKLRLIKRVVSVTAAGSCILEGDNPLESTDSRVFGPVTPGQILGRVTGRFS